MIFVSTENNIPFSRDLEELMELYKIEKEDRLLFSEESSLNLTPEFRSKVLYKNYICETYVITIYAYFNWNPVILLLLCQSDK
jgi:hypothetical protein